MKEKLKPCPFCGGEAKIRKDITGLTEVWCYDCLTNTGLQPPGDYAIKKWNTRPAEDALKASNEKMRKVLEKQCIACRMRDHECECGFCSIYEALANVEYFNTTEKNNEQTEAQKHHA